MSRAQGLTPIIPALWEAKMGGSVEVKSLRNIVANVVKPCLMNAVQSLNKEGIHFSLPQSITNKLIPLMVILASVLE